MAAEYSRELSKKIARAQRLQAGLGYKQGGHVVCGVRRRVVDKNGRVRTWLGPGQRKALATDKVIFEHGPASEVALVRRIFRMYALEGHSIARICDILLAKGIMQPNGRPWIRSTVSRLLQNDLYTGIYVFGRVANNLGRPKSIPDCEWIRSKVMEPIVSASLFAAAADRIAATSRRHWSDSELEAGLARLLVEQGYISGPAINAAAYLPNQYVFYRRYGSLEAACRLVGYEKPVRPSKNHLRKFTDENLLDELRRIHRERGYLSGRTINEDAATPKATYFARKLGGLRKAYFLADIRQGAGPKERAHRHPDGQAMSDDDLLDGLRRLWLENGYLTLKMIDEDPRLPCSDFYNGKFGGLVSAYRRIGYYRSRSAVMKAAYMRKKDREGRLNSV